MKRLMFPILLMALILTISSCGEDPNEPNPPAANPGNPTPMFQDMDGVFAAIQVISYQTVPIVGELAVYTDASVAALIGPNGAYQNAGDVTVNSYSHNLLDGNSYVLPDPNNPTQLDFDFSTTNSNSWVVSGSADVTGFSHTTSDQMPSDIKFDGDYTTVPAGQDLVVSIETAPFNTDSILFVVAFNNTVLNKTVGPNVTSATFTASELDGASGTGVVQAAAYNYELGVYNGKNYYFINETVISQVSEF